MQQRGDIAFGRDDRTAVAVVILNWNNFEDSLRCVDSVLASDYPSVIPIVVDNASTDDSLRRLENRFGGLRFVRNRNNLGFSGGCNAGIRDALSTTSCKYVIIANNDCRLAPSAIREAVQEADSDPSIGVITPKILFDETSRKFWHTGGTISRLRGRSRARGFGERDVGQYDVAEDTQWASGALMMVRREVFEKVGLLSEEYFFGVEEWDFSLAVRRGGYRIRYCPRAEAYHAGDGSHGNTDPRFVYNYYRNKLIFQQKHLGRTAFAMWKIAFRFYVHVLLPRQSMRLAKRYGYTHSLDLAYQTQFAAQTALKDHGTNSLSEKTLNDFGTLLKTKYKEITESR